MISSSCCLDNSIFLFSLKPDLPDLLQVWEQLVADQRLENCNEGGLGEYGSTFRLLKTYIIYKIDWSFQATKIVYCQHCRGTLHISMSFAFKLASSTERQTAYKGIDIEILRMDNAVCLIGCLSLTA